MKDVVIRGDGVAACCCAHLLGAAGFPTFMEQADRAKVPAIMLSEATQALISDVFERKDLFDGLPQIRSRVVAWGPQSNPIRLPHSAVIISEQDLSERLRPKPAGARRDQQTAAEWMVLASRPLPPSTIEHHFGSRVAAALAVELPDGADETACWIESIESGWLFLIPGAGRTGWLLAVGNTPESLLARSRLVVERIRTPGRKLGEFPAYPRIAAPLCGPGWLACGTAALAFDPLCGDGTGHAIREAILAAAAIQAVARGADPDGVLAHYRARLLAGFKRHLELCQEFYRGGHRGPWWDAELNLILEGLKWCDREIGSGGRFRYQLRGFELHPIPDITAPA